jgi:hypothetical protein
VHWCTQLLQKLGHGQIVECTEFFERGEPLIPNWYRQFVGNVRGHVLSQALPTLGLAPRPYVDGDEQKALEYK